jgi:signal transduction histidine kinase
MANSFMKHKQPGLLPNRLIIAVLVVLGLAIMGSAVFTYMTFLRLRSSYLSNRGREIVDALDNQVRGPGRRNNPAFWQSVLESNFEAYSGSAAFLALADQSGNILAYKGSSVSNDANSIYYYEESLSHPRNHPNETTPRISGWKIRIGLLSSDTNFIQRQANLQIAISTLAVIALFVLSFALIRMLNRFIELKAREGAEAQLKSLGVMAASLAHEIRNPLGAMKGLTQLVQEDLPSDHTAQEQLRTVVSEAERLERLIADLLDFAHAKEPQISEFNLMDLLSDIRHLLQFKLNSSQIILQAPDNADPLQIRSDPAGIRQVLLNVLINAMDATPAHGTVRLTVQHIENDKSVVIMVDDSGAGLQNNPSELFQPFVTTKARGTGLGLAISKQIMEKLGGSLNLENLPHGGARCSIKFPMD